MSKSKPFFAKLWRSLSEKLKESLTSVLPVSILVFVLSLTPWVDISHYELAVFEGAALLLIIGIGFFNLGADISPVVLRERDKLFVTGQFAFTNI